MAHNPGYQPPAVQDAGAVVEVTLGNNNFDTNDDFSAKSYVLNFAVPPTITHHGV
ncbi:lasso RiPP family leader peptide-containing protein [Streptomyces aidingensis]|uniref:Uncharacterized protein n=1 Tax=Streptomyces aidingensis TaxID=910347 RepID=A0A1I1GYC1_9ACTN|nr:lasso RiPP family leader peptide-containing protein [Streptomyces aidingensis]SFC16486.1 hypothetical protein SAMN05421773_102174 [Streptomyces aidingensis]